MSPKVSIIIPCYNIATHIKKCVISLLCQSMPDFELLLIDDGSTDKTLELLNVFEKQDSRIRVFSHTNQGVSATRNRGIVKAQADWLMFIDGDDYVKPDFLEQHLQYAEIGIWPISGMVNVSEGGIENKSEDFTKLIEKFPSGILNNENLFEIIVFESISSPCARLYYKDDLIKHNIKFSETLSYQEDLMFNLEYLKYIDQIQILNYFGYYYVKNEESSSSRYHVNFNHLPLLLIKLQEIAGKNKSLEKIKPFLFDTLLKKVSNSFHKESGNNFITKKKEMKELFNSMYFFYVRNFIYESSINSFYKTALYFRSFTGLYIYYRLYNFLKK
ncbi:glycosyltransferase family 2 protein [Flavobacterium psychrolimnae]|uniref:glycosyltransferase family 2 protein n=1 Tax=Flavobacterium psychrolimnae TaxID=249351 RepID=UPI00142D5CF8|nr:glycosyltransferase family 2 protein [Flavobacterium psychrolimnae]